MTADQGTSMPDKGSMPTRVPLDAEGRVAEDLACIQCGYNLRTLQREAKCPECGSEVARSIRGDWLQYSDPEWLSKIIRGLSVMLAMVALGMCLTFVVPAGMALGEAVGGEAGSLISALAPIAGGVAFVAVGIGMIVGLGLFTASEPNRASAASGVCTRILVMGCASVSIVAELASVFLEQHPISLVVAALGAVAALCSCAAVLLHVRRLALRIPDESAAASAWLLFVGLCIGIGLTSIGLAQGLTSPLRLLNPIVAPWVCLNFVLVIGYLAFLAKFRRILMRIASPRISGNTVSSSKLPENERRGEDA
jgi:hypothetical protein